MKSRSFLISAFLLALTSGAGAQSVGRMLQDDFTNAGKDILGVWGSPFHASQRDWLLSVAALGAFSASMLADQEVSDWAIRNDSSTFFRGIKPVRRGGWLFSGKYVVPPVAAAYVVGVAIRNQDIRDAVTGCMSAWGAQSAVRKVTYALLGRARPDTMPDDPQNWKVPGGGWMMRSFPAGHFANAMACATFWNKRFDLGAAGPLVYAFAATVGVGRLADRAHWTSDTVLGGILGYAVGKEVAKRSLHRDRERERAGAQAFVAPDVTGITLGLRWSF